MTISRVLLRPVAGLLTAIVAASGCSSSNSPSQPPQPVDRWPAVMSDFSFVWSGEPGIDLLSQPAVVVRAYLESVSAASAAGSNDYLYPGFQSAVAKTVSKDPSNYSMDLWPELHYPWTQPTVGTSREHILRVTEDALRTTAVICHFGWGVARKGENGFYAASAQWDGAMTGVGAFRLSLKAPASSATRGLRPQQGPSPRRSLIHSEAGASWRSCQNLHLPTQSVLAPSGPSSPRTSPPAPPKLPNPKNAGNSSLPASTHGRTSRLCRPTPAGRPKASSR